MLEATLVPGESPGFCLLVVGLTGPEASAKVTPQNDHGDPSGSGVMQGDGADWARPPVVRVSSTSRTSWRLLIACVAGYRFTSMAQPQLTPQDRAPARLIARLPHKRSDETDERVVIVARPGSGGRSSRCRAAAHWLSGPLGSGMPPRRQHLQLAAQPRRTPTRARPLGRTCQSGLCGSRISRGSRVLSTGSRYAPARSCALLNSRPHRTSASARASPTPATRVGSSRGRPDVDSPNEDPSVAD